jgi:competence transcription factor ComK
MKKITIVGGGSSAHTLIPVLSKSKYKVNLLTSKPDQWDYNIETQYIDPNGIKRMSIFGKIETISNKPEDVIPGSEIIILCMPVHKYREALHNIAPHIKGEKVFIGTIYGQAGFNWMVAEIINTFDLKGITAFAFGLIPWICRISKYGKTGVTYGPKEFNIVAVSPASDFEYLNNNFLSHLCFDWFETGKFHLAENFLSLTLSVDNQIIHTSRLYDLSQKTRGIWNSQEDVPFFYKGYTTSSATMLKKLDYDYSLIRNKIKSMFPHMKFTYMLDYLALERLSYQSENSDILESFLNSKTLGQIKTPVTYDNGQFIIDKSHRFFFDDIYYGLMIAKWFAEQLDIEVRTIDQILSWAQIVLNDEIIKNGKLILNLRDQFKDGIPRNYGIKSIRECIE